MINTTDFLNALRSFEHIAGSKHLPAELKIKVKDNLLSEVEKLKNQINEVDLGEETPELIHGVNNDLKKLIKMGYCTPNDPTEEPLYSWITCPDCNGDGWIENEDGDIEKCCRCNGEGEVIFEQE